MANVAIDSFMALLAEHMRASAGLPTSPRALFLYVAPESPATPTWSVLRPYASRLDYVPVLTVSVQCKTIGDDALALEQARKLYESLLGSDGRPLRRKDLTGHRVLGVMELRAPAIIGRDERKRAEVVFNFDAQVIAIP